MRTIRRLLILASALCAAAGTAPAFANGGRGHGGFHGHTGFHGHGGVRFGVFLGGPLFWGPPYYYPPYYYPPVVAVPDSPPVYIQQDEQAAPADQNWWYFCRDSNAYYPYVNQCPGGWQRVSPQPPPG